MLKDILDNLEFISNVPPNAKPNFSDKSYTFTTEWFSTLKRRYKNEKGEKGLISMENLISEIEENYKSLDHKRLKDALENSLRGLTNIIHTYKLENQKEVYQNYEAYKKRIENIISELDGPKKFFVCKAKVI